MFLLEGSWPIRAALAEREELIGCSEEVGHPLSFYRRTSVQRVKGYCAPLTARKGDAHWILYNLGDSISIPLCMAHIIILLVSP